MPLSPLIDFLAMLCLCTEDDDDEVEEGQVVEEKVDQLLKQAREKTDGMPSYVVAALVS